jgi:hypothetical protein
VIALGKRPGDFVFEIESFTEDEGWHVQSSIFNLRFEYRFENRACDLSNTQIAD